MSFISQCSIPIVDRNVLTAYCQSPMSYDTKKVVWDISWALCAVFLWQREVWIWLVCWAVYSYVLNFSLWHSTPFRRIVAVHNIIRAHYWKRQLFICWLVFCMTRIHLNLFCIPLVEWYDAIVISFVRWHWLLQRRTIDWCSQIMSSSSMTGCGKSCSL